MYIVTANSSSWHCSSSSASCYVSRALTSLRKLYEQVQCMLPAFFLVWYHDVMVKTWGHGRPATVPCIGATLTTVKEGCYTKIVRPRSDQGLRRTDKY